MTAKKGGKAANGNDFTRYVSERMARQLASGFNITREMSDEEQRAFKHGYQLAVEDLWTEVDAVFRRFSKYPCPIRKPVLEKEEGEG